MSDIKKIMEAENRVEALKFMQINESNIEKLEVVLAIKSGIADKLQRASEQLMNYSVDVLGPIVDRIKAEEGIEVAEEFQSRVKNILQHAADVVMDAKDQITNETLKLTGDVADNPDVADIGIDDDLTVDEETPTFDMESDASFDDIEEPVPEDRAMKESVQYTQVGIKMESTKGTIGTKYFSTHKEAEKWLKENESKVKKVLGFEKK
ncbi:hypothetical protein [Klebsiella phage phiKp_21]|uniref:Uncharacterized protein n=1 Tax=Klebsiella phage vB_KleM_RaK2 TaxID=1147094 RepID=H6X3U2_9CAUD|nr:virion structural protein [Klebsiella phage vB_KleM_RaK2]YP_010843058.1 virion structural protein [Klebsiella phage K64-1]QOE32547.1 hypothetical protein CPT_Muenster_375 [Klebsiella phage Muenster]UYL05023.1 hypothetical protein DIDNDMLP_00032 [Klebsiella phage KP13-7]BEH88140.1 hypothetical protein [Klebsiella phage phiKp_21]AFA44408.1 hypothetical protein RaK2_00135 [Klebsiella phage vB_KleM_RaK2]